MWIPKEVVPALEAEVRDLLAVAEADPEESFDPNDFVIFEGFVLPILEGARETGFESGDMLDKGFGFLIGLIPSVLGRARAELPPAHFGMLARIYHRHLIGRLLNALEYPDDASYEENLPGLYRDLDLIRQIQPRPSP